MITIGLATCLSVVAPAHVFGQSSTKSAAPLARYFPRQDLVAYAEFDGLSAHRDVWNKSAIYRLLNQTSTGALYQQAIARILDLVVANQQETPGRGLIWSRSGCICCARASQWGSIARAGQVRRARSRL
jgi:hypothetical protein